MRTIKFKLSGKINDLENYDVLVDDLKKGSFSVSIKNNIVITLSEDPIYSNDAVLKIMANELHTYFYLKYKMDVILKNNVGELIDKEGNIIETKHAKIV